MSQSKHTPGPWKAEVSEKSASINILGVHGDKMRCRSSDGHGSIVIVECNEDGRDEMFAHMLPEQIDNARLIAAAPELLEAAELAIEGVEVLDLLIASIKEHGNYSVESTLGFLNQARCARLRLTEAIAKATGAA